MKEIIISQHAKDQLQDRGASTSEVERAIREGEPAPAKRGRMAFRKNFLFDSVWKEKYYKIKQVMPIVVAEDDRWVVVTVYVFYFGGDNL